MNTEALERSKRDVIREKMFASRNRKKVTIHIFGEDVELRQPSLGDLMDARDEQESKRIAARMIMNYCYVPNTDERVFEDADLESILEMPFNDELMTIQNAISGLTGVDIKDVKEEEKN